MKRAECFHHFIDRDLLENTVFDYLMDAKNYSGRTEEITTKDSQNEVDAAQLKAGLKKLDIKMQRQIELFEDADISKEDFRIARDRIHKERMAIEERLHEAETGTRVALENEFIKRLGSMNNELHSKNRGEQKMHFVNL